MGRGREVRKMDREERKARNVMYRKKVKKYESNKSKTKERERTDVGEGVERGRERKREVKSGKEG